MKWRARVRTTSTSATLCSKHQPIAVLSVVVSLALTAINFAACAPGRSASLPLVPLETVAAWVTTGDQSRLLAREPNLHFNCAAVDSSIAVIEVDYSREFQSVVGWGAAAPAA